MRGISKIVSTIALLAMVVAGIGAVWYVFSGNLSAYSSAALIANVKGSYDGSKAILEVTIRNTGGSAAKIVSILIDDSTNVTNQIIDPGEPYLASGSSIQKVITASIKPGRHVLKIVYEEHGTQKETYVEFTI